MISALAFALALSSIDVRTIDNRPVELPSKTAKATLLLFVGTDCPISNRLAPFIADIEKTYKEKEVDIELVYPDRETKVSDVQAHMKRYKLEGSAIIDRTHSLVKLAKATLTPEAFVFLPNGTIVYHGRINDMYAEHNRPKNEIARHDVKIALDEILAGKPVSRPYQPSIGCAITQD